MCRCDRSAPTIGSGNNSAVLYHFGSKEKLVEAIFEYRLPRLRERRRRTHRRAPTVGPAGLAGVPDRRRPRAERARRQQLHELRRVHLPTRWGSVQAPAAAVRERPARIRGATARLPHQRRRAAAQPPTRSGHGFIVQAAANASTHAPGDGRCSRFALELANLVDCMVGFLEAPVSPASRAALERADRHRRPPDAVRLSRYPGAADAS